MKKQIVRTFVFMLTFCIYFNGCKQESRLAGNLKFDIITHEESQHLFDDASKPEAKLKIDFSFIKESSDEKMKDSVNHMLQKLVFGEKYSIQEPQQSVKLFADNYFSTYHKDLEPMYREENTEMGGEPNETWYSYEYETETKVEYYDKHLLTYRFYMEEFTGGAHSIYFTYFQNIDLRTLKQIELNDLLIPSSVTAPFTPTPHPTTTHHPLHVSPLLTPVSPSLHPHLAGFTPFFLLSGSELCS